MIRKARHWSWKDQFKFVVLGLVTIYEGLVMTLSLGFLNSDARAKLLMSEWIDD